MTLTLTMLRCPDAVPPETRHVTGGEFSVGRGPDNDWVLPDPERHLSKRHCVLAYRRGGWQIAGTSSNGTFLNSAGEPLESGPPRTLADGDRIQLGAYDIEVRIEDEPARAERSGGFRADPFGDKPLGEPPRSPCAARGGDAASPENGFGLPAAFNPLSDDEEGFVGPTHADHSAAVTDALQISSPRSVLPDDWDVDVAPSPAPEIGDRAPTAGRPVAPAPAPPGPGPEDLLAAFLRGAGMEDAGPSDPARAMEQLGAAFRALVAGIRSVLIARAAVKSEFRIEQTMIRRSGNNPLKFSADDDAALAAMLGAGRRSDMGPEEAVTDALGDIRLHELVTMAAMQHAVRALVGRLAPEAIRRGADQSGGLGLPGARKARAWDAFESLHGEIARGLSDDFDSVFGKSFARAYEHALAELAERDGRE